MLQPELQSIFKEVNISKLNSRKMLLMIKEHFNQETKDKTQKLSKSLMISNPTLNINANINFPFPGPGTYTEQKITKSFSKGKTQLGGNSKRTDFTLSRKLPGPGQYESKITNRIDRLKSIQSIKIGTSKRPPLQQGTILQSPGPGKYEYKSKIIEGPIIKFKGSSYDPITKEIRKIPGVGLYDTKFIPKQNAPQYKIGQSQRYDFTKYSRDTPEPGKYNIEVKQQSPSFAFGKEIRHSMERKTCAPGPGIYEIKPMFADVPAYIRDHKISK